MGVRFTNKAEGDLEEIADYIAEDDPDTAVEFAMDIREACLGLAEYPLRYPKTPPTAAAPSLWQLSHLLSRGRSDRDDLAHRARSPRLREA